MKLLVLGAAGPTGRLVVSAALERGDTVTALVRSGDVEPALPGEVTVIVGDATSTSDVARAMEGQDAVISALGRGRSIRAEGLFSAAAKAVVAAATATGVKRLVWMSSFGVGDTLGSATVTQKVMYRTMLRNIYADKEAAEVILRDGGVEWTFVYPSALTNGPAKGTYRVDDRIEMKGAPRISRADVADFMVKAAHSAEWIRRDAVITD